MAYVRTVKTASGATAVQIVWSSRRGSRNIEHVGSAHDEAQVEALKAAAGQRMAEGQGEFDLGLDLAEIGSAPLEIIGSRPGICGTACAWPTRCSVWIVPPAATRCSGIWCWRASSSRPARSTRCGCWQRPVSTRCPTGR